MISASLLVVQPHHVLDAPFADAVPHVQIREKHNAQPIPVPAVLGDLNIVLSHSQVGGMKNAQHTGQDDSAPKCAAEQQLGIAAMPWNPFRLWNMPKNQRTDFDDDIYRKQIDEDAVKSVGNAQDSLSQRALRQKMRNRMPQANIAYMPAVQKDSRFAARSGRFR